MAKNLLKTLAKITLKVDFENVREALIANL
jgi:hypothetical protein